MGILNLHKFLEKCVSKNHLSALRGSVLGVDAMCWLHRGSVASAWELLTGQDTDKFLRFFVKMLSLCHACGVKVIVVFDGASLPAKAQEESVRRERRQENAEKARAELAGKKISNFSQIDPKLKSMIVQSVSISPAMISRCMSVLRRLGIDFLVAPYEADAQLAYMYSRGEISGVISEDSDLLAFGCHRLISKLDTSGDFADLRIEWAFAKSTKRQEKPPDLGPLGKLENWDQAKFVDLCILAGSDYKLGKIAGIGIKKAFTLLCRFGSIERVLRDFMKWTKAEIDEYLRTNLTFSRTAFLHHRVFDLSSKACVLLSPSSLEQEEVIAPIVGPAIDPKKCLAIMTGEIDAKTGEKREFLHKLPPGILGKYVRWNEHVQAEDDAANFSDEKTSYSAMEAQIVAEFAKNKNFVPFDNSQYLSSLELMILKPTDAEDEFGDIEALIDLEEMDQEDENIIVIEPEEEKPKYKNPFQGSSKKPKTVEQTHVVFTLPKPTAEPPPNHPLMALLRQSEPVFSRRSG